MADERHGHRRQDSRMHVAGSGSEQDSRRRIELAYFRHERLRGRARIRGDFHLSYRERKNKISPKHSDGLRSSLLNFHLLHSLLHQPADFFEFWSAGPANPLKYGRFARSDSRAGIL